MRPILAVAAALTFAGAMPALPAGAAGSTPTLKLVPADTDVTIYRRAKRAIPLDIAVYVAAVDGPWELHVFRDGYTSPIELEWWLDGGEVRPLDPSLLEGWFGLADFLQVEVRHEATGRLKLETSTSFCPETWDRDRVNDSGPDVPSYPSYGCYGMPFTLGTVWGIDEGWGVNAFDVYGAGAPYFLSADGTFTARVSIDDAYVEAFDLAPRASSTTVTVHVVTDPGCHWPCYGRRGRLVGAGSPVADRPERAAVRSVPSISEPDPATLPDLVALPAWSMRAQNRKKGEFLTFASNIWNAGPGTLEVEGFRRSGEDVMDAYQYFYADGEPVGRAPVGSFEYDDRDGHTHWHFRQFASYTLLDADMNPVVPSTKEAFCLAPTDPIDLTVEGAEWTPYEIGLGTQCGDIGSLWVREVLETGWGDTYFQWLPGQSFDITGLPNGRYYVQVTTNPGGLLHEVDDSNNTSIRRVVLRGTPGDRRVVVPPWNGIDTEGCYYC